MGTRVMKVGPYDILWNDIGSILERYYAKQAIAEALFGWLP